MKNSLSHLKSIVALLTISATIVAFQNCGSPNGGSAVVAAASCANTSVLKNAFPSGFSTSIPQGTTIDCSNGTSFDTLSFQPGNQSVILSRAAGGVAPVTYNLRTGGAACDPNMKTGGDDFANSSGTVLSTQLSATQFRVVADSSTLVGGAINCIVNR